MTYFPRLRCVFKTKDLTVWLHPFICQTQLVLTYFGQHYGLHISPCLVISLQRVEREEIEMLVLKHKQRSELVHMQKMGFLRGKTTIFVARAFFFMVHVSGIHERVYEFW